jgi:drug/metabolite transporter (DMT)-like permease
MSKTTSQKTGKGLISPGIRDMIIAAFFFSVMGVLVKAAGQRLASTEIVFFRSLVAFILSYWAIKKLGLHPWGYDKKFLILRGLIGFGALSCFFYALTKLTLADAMVIQFTNPIFATLLAAVWLREKVGPRELFAAGLSLLGVVMVARPPMLFGNVQNPPDPLALTVAIMGSLGAACVYVIIRKLRKTDHHLVIVFYFPLIGLPLSVPTMMPSFRWPTWIELVMLIGMGICVQIAQIHMTRGLHRETAGRATAVSYLQVAFAFVWGILFFQEKPPLLSILGASLILLGVVIVAWVRDDKHEEVVDMPE